MQVNPYLFFAGQCEAAFRSYEKILGGKIVAMMTHAGTPAAEHVGPEMQDKILHACLEFGDGRLMGSDGAGEDAAPKGFSVQVSIEKVADAERVFKALAEGGKVSMALEQTFWATRFGMLVDQFGIPWMINCYEGMEQGVTA